MRYINRIINWKTIFGCKCFGKSATGGVNFRNFFELARRNLFSLKAFNTFRSFGDCKIYR